MQTRCRAARRVGRAARAPIRAGLALALLASLIVVGCGEQRGPIPVVVSRPRSTARYWEHLDEARGWPLAADGIPSAHGANEFVVRIRVAPQFRSAYLGLVAGQRWPIGMAVAAFHERRDTHAAGSVYAMMKIGDDGWEYVVSRADGALEARGSIPLCARCHAEAPADSLFGLPGTSTESITSASRSPDSDDPR